ncbi:branched-chain amino acid ABC transporter permease [Kitasatospora sp. NPDC096147]|uniref:branched-chain amino acid ABC transporter permease n=1 Tax=Kitasatospora sp. NPDC096147 TaxID=3364093 RepID=UPI00380D2ACE
MTTTFLPASAARAVTAAGAVLTAASSLLAWTWTDEFPGDLTYDFSPAGLQWVALGSGLVTLLYVLASYDVRGLRWLAPAGSSRPLLLLGLGALLSSWLSIAMIAYQLGGLANLEPGGWVLGVGSLATAIGAYQLPDDRRTAGPAPKLSSWAEILIIIAVFAVGLLLFAFGIGAEKELFSSYLFAVVPSAIALSQSGLVRRFSDLTARHRAVATGGAFAAAAAFPFTQSSELYILVGVNILVFATVALGLNVVVGLTGLLDLGYVAFLGVGAYAAALVSGSQFSVFRDWQVPFPLAVLIGAVAALVFGVVIGAPTLRLRGDYLAIVTLGFGEIFRIAMNNMDGTSGPSITNGPNGIGAIPQVNILGFDFGQTHSLFGLSVGKFSNYMLLMLVVTAIVVLVFSRVSDSRIGRAWVAIREDETAAEAMGINGFRVKLIAFALGATLAGMAGAVQAHVQSAVTPEVYVFAGAVPPNSAFLLAAVILGGMGTISGPLLGASLLYLIPAKLEFLKDFQLLAFGVALIVLMRVRPAGLVAGRRQQLEFETPGIPVQAAPGDTVLTKAGA